MIVGTCHRCETPQPVFRKVAIADEQGVILDSAFFCENCWKQPRMRAAIQEIDLEDRPTVDERSTPHAGGNA